MLPQKLKISVALLCVITLITAFTGCSLPAFTGNYMRPPRLEGEQEALQLAFESSVGGNSVLKSPSKGEYQSSFVLYDVDSDGDEEAFVFYSDISVDEAVRVHILDKQNGVWVSAADIKSSGSAVYMVEFADVNSDGLVEIFISWSLFESKNNRLITIIDVTKTAESLPVFTARANEYFSYMSLFDIDSDGFLELSLIYFDDAADVGRTVFRVFDFVIDNTISMLSEVMLDSEITSVSSVLFEPLESICRIYIDSLKSDKGRFTEIVVWSSADLSLIRELAAPGTDTFRDFSLNCMDVDNDGHPEIPVAENPRGNSEGLSLNADGTLRLRFVKWLSFSDGELSSDGFAMLNPRDSYLFMLNSEEVESVDVMFDSKSDSVIFYTQSPDVSPLDNMLFSICFLSDVSAIPTDKLLVYASSAGNFWCSISALGTDNGITLEMITDNLVLVR